MQAANAKACKISLVVMLCFLVAMELLYQRILVAQEFFKLFSRGLSLLIICRLCAILDGGGYQTKGFR